MFHHVLSSILASILAFDVPEKKLSDRIRHNANISPNILRPLHAGWKLETVVEQNMRQQHLDFVAGEEAAGAGVRTDSPMQLVGVVGCNELVERY